MSTITPTTKSPPQVPTQSTKQVSLWGKHTVTILVTCACLVGLSIGVPLILAGAGITPVAAAVASVFSQLGLSGFMTETALLITGSVITSSSLLGAILYTVLLSKKKTDPPSTNLTQKQHLVQRQVSTATPNTTVPKIPTSAAQPATIKPVTINSRKKQRVEPPANPEPQIRRQSQFRRRAPSHQNDQ